MAITRAQQFRQMLEDGGMLVSPSRDGRRPGYRRSKYDSSGGGTASSSTSKNRSPGPGDKDDNREQYSVFSKKTADTSKKSFKKAKQNFRDERDRIFAKPRKQPITFGAPNFLDERFSPGGQLNPITTQKKFKTKTLLDDFYGDDQEDDAKAMADAMLNQDFKGRRVVDGQTDLRTRPKKLEDLKKQLEEFKANRRKVTIPGLGLSKGLEGIAQALSDFGAKFNRPFFERVIAAERIPGLNLSTIMNMNPQEIEDAYDSYMKDRLAGKTDAMGNLAKGFMRDAQGNIISTGNDGRDSVGSDLEQRLQLLEQQNAALKNTTPTTTDSPLGGLGLRFLAEGGMPEDAPVGGIMDIESGRQMYFLGKLVKKAKRAVGKIAKSPLGKAALIGGGAYLLGGGIIPGVSGKLIPFAKYGSSAGSGFGLGNILPNILNIAKMPGLAEKAFSASTAGKVFAGITAASLLPLLGLGTGKEDEDEAEEILRGSGIDIASIRNNPYTFRSSVGGSGLARRFVADGGRIGFRDGTSEFIDFVRSMGLSEDKLKQLDINSYNAVLQAFQRAKEGQKPQTEEKEMAEGGKAEPVAKDTMPLLKMGGKEMDLRDNGGFVPIGRMERADDVPARLSKNEFVFTADAVRNAGGGDIDKGAEVMYNMMQNLESGGEVSEESQGLKGAREMFQTSKRLEEVL